MSIDQNASSESLLKEITVLRQRLADLEGKLTAKNRAELQPRKDGGDICTDTDDAFLPPMDLRPHRSLSGMGVPMSCTRVVMNQIIMPAECDSLGICIGGQVLSWIDVCAGMCAKSLARGPCVTASLDSVHFLRPCCLGTIVIIAAMVNRTFSSSMEIGVRVEAEDMRTGVRRHCCSANLIFVAVARDVQSGRRPNLPRVIPTSPEQEQVYSEADQRRARRVQQKQELLRDPNLAAANLELCRLKPITHRDGCPNLPMSVEVHRSFTEEGEALSPEFPSAPRRRLVTPDLTSAYMTQSIMPQHANTLNITFGGQVLAWMEQCAYISASRMRGPHCLTASMDSITFGRATQVGDILYLSSQVTAIFGSSMEVMVSVHGEDPLIGELFHCADAYVTVVTVQQDRGATRAGSRGLRDGYVSRNGYSPDGGSPTPASSNMKADAYHEPRVKPVQLPFELKPKTPAEILRHEGAIKRREERLHDRMALLATLPGRSSLDGRVGGVL